MPANQTAQASCVDDTGLPFRGRLVCDDEPCGRWYRFARPIAVVGSLRIDGSGSEWRRGCCDGRFFLRRGSRMNAQEAWR